MAYSKMYNDYLSKIFPNSSVLSVRGVDYGIVRVGGKVARRHDIRMSPPLCHDLQGPLANCVDIMHYSVGMRWTGVGSSVGMWTGTGVRTSVEF